MQGFVLNEELQTEVQEASKDTIRADIPTQEK